ncbi:hypothetical protein BO99DRAFT_179860 [Aspergillus violaceofuscus CBS 115571]|uniref:Peptidase C14 caspase domain-containing protein n=1 Tax=Aspergillus violaceofuscus (strain CBS 115571) TaxID=1450538 RepID=A0A2V5HPE1_ASPV1|nr:hypothetical protein BO99DRAFT_179860 [Aspergillus violaceofuscus CBS 115571]
MAPITLNQFRDTMTAAASQRGRDYTNVYAVTAHWEEDDTKAERDVAAFKRMLTDLNLAPAVEYIIRRCDSNPGKTFLEAVLEWLEEFKAKSETDHNLLIFHYAGHGMMKHGSFCFVETKLAKRLINADNCLLNILKDSSIIADSDHFDVLLILDCCFSHVATRAPAVPRRVLEVLAATSTQTPTAKYPPNHTFTAKIAEEIAHRKRAGHKHVEFADIFQTLKLRSGKVKPTHELLVGVASVLLPLNGQQTIDPTLIPPNLTVLFSISVSEDLKPEELRELSKWVRSLPRFAGLTLDSVYPTSSMAIIMRSSLSVYAKLHQVEGYRLIAENAQPPLELNRLLQPAPSSSASKKENVPFQGFKR